MSDTKPSARAMAAAEAIVGDAYFITTFAERLAHYIDQEMPAHDELLAACKAADVLLQKLVLIRESSRELDASEVIATGCLIGAAVALAEPEQKENE